MLVAEASNHPRHAVRRAGPGDDVDRSRRILITVERRERPLITSMRLIMSGVSQLMSFITWVIAADGTFCGMPSTYSAVSASCVNNEKPRSLMAVPVPPGTRDQFEGGVQLAFGNWVVVDVGDFYKKQKTRTTSASCSTHRLRSPFPGIIRSCTASPGESISCSAEASRRLR
jgi:hypothetical protein